MSGTVLVLRIPGAGKRNISLCPWSFWSYGESETSEASTNENAVTIVVSVINERELRAGKGTPACH